jgi:hypothetical protein
MQIRIKIKKLSGSMDTPSTSIVRDPNVAYNLLVEIPKEYKTDI